MSRVYDMTVEIEGYDKKLEEKIKSAASEEWPFDEWQQYPDCPLTAGAEGNLCGGEQEDKFAARLAKAIWTANGGPCKVTVNATYLEDLPCETYALDEEDYDKVMAKQPVE